MPADTTIHLDDVAVITRPALDRRQQIIAHSSYSIGGFGAPPDTTTNPATVPTATGAASA